MKRRLYATLFCLSFLGMMIDSACSEIKTIGCPEGINIRVLEQIHIPRYDGLDVSLFGGSTSDETWLQKFADEQAQIDKGNAFAATIQDRCYRA